MNNLIIQKKCSIAFISLERTIFKRAGPDVTMAFFWTFCNTRGSLVVFARASVLWESRHSQKSSCLSKSHERLASLCYSRQRPYILPKNKNQIKKKPESTYAMRNRRGTVRQPPARCLQEGKDRHKRREILVLAWKMLWVVTLKE